MGWRVVVAEGLYVCCVCVWGGGEGMCVFVCARGGQACRQGGEEAHRHPDTHPQTYLGNANTHREARKQNAPVLVTAVGGVEWVGMWAGRQASRHTSTHQQTHSPVLEAAVGEGLQLRHALLLQRLALPVVWAVGGVSDH